MVGRPLLPFNLAHLRGAACQQRRLSAHYAANKNRRGPGLRILWGNPRRFRFAVSVSELDTAM